MVFLRLFEFCTREHCTLIAIISWSLWNRRNKWVWDKVNSYVFSVKAAALNLLTDWKGAQVSTCRRTAQVGTRDCFWTKPAESWIKVNTDASVFNNGSIGLGCVMRDDQGVFLGARCCNISGAWSPREAEAMRMKEVLLWVLSRRLNHCVIETDSQILVDACNGGPGESYFSIIVRDCIYLLKHINPVCVRFIYRSANSVAHEIAKTVYYVLGVCEWFDNPPVC